MAKLCLDEPLGALSSEDVAEPARARRIRHSLLDRACAKRHSRHVQGLEFSKYEGLGNDFIVVDLRNHPVEDVDAVVDRFKADVVELCDRRRGIGADGLLLVSSMQGGDRARMTVINSDGSRPEMCGNGLRCVAHHVARRAGVRGGQSWSGMIDTDHQPLHCSLEMGPEGAGSAETEIAMGAAIHGSDCEFPGITFGRFSQVSMGNPHAISFVDDPNEDLEQLTRTHGPILTRAPVFPKGANIEFARREGPQAISLWVWERGAGLTSACGTGACATAAAAVRRGLCPANEAIRVRLPGGVLQITVPNDPKLDVRMRGPSRWVFDGRNH